MRNTKKVLPLILLGLSVGLVAADLTESNRTTLTRHTVGAQQMAGQAENLMREGNRLFLEDKYMEAVKRYIEAKQRFEQFRSPEFERRVKACDEQIRRCYFQWAEEAYAEADRKMQEKDFDAALARIREAVERYPESKPRAKAKIAELEKRKAAANMREKTNSQALVSDQENQNYRIEVLMRQGQELARAGRYAEAAQKFNSVLMINPYHATALHDLKAVNIRNRKVAENRYRAEHRKIVTETEWRWTIPGIQEAKDRSAASEGPVLKEADSASELEKKIKAIVLPEFKVENRPVPLVVRALQEASRIYDPEKGEDGKKGGRGVNIFLRRPSALLALQQQQQQQGEGEGGPEGGPEAGGPAPGPAPAPAPAPEAKAGGGDDEEVEEGEVGENKNQATVTMDIRKRTLEYALRELCRVAKLRMRVDSHAVVLAPENVALSDMETVLFPVEKSIFGDTNTEDKNALMNFFKDREVSFPQGAKIVYVSLLSRLVVTNTAENLSKIEEILQLLQEDREPLVEITAKFMEVSQNNLKELGFQYSISYNPGNVPYNELGVPGNYSSHRLSFYDAGTGLLRSSNTSANGSLIVLNGYTGSGDQLNYNVNVNALNQLNSSDALASPRIITLPGMPAHIEMVRKVPFVDDYDDAETSEDSGSSNNSNSYRTYTYKGPMPSFQDATPLGITMDVEPKVDKVNRKITLQVKPLVRTHVGWTTWESTSSSGNKEVMRKPILAERTIDTTVTINDGKTIVLGGVVDDQAEVLDDKIPILGDLPLVGRFFQSRYTQAEKRNLLIFITCRLINPDGTPYHSEKTVPNGLPSLGRIE